MNSGILANIRKQFTGESRVSRLVNLGYDYLDNVEDKYILNKYILNAK